MIKNWVKIFLQRERDETRQCQTILLLSNLDNGILAFDVHETGTLPKPGTFYNFCCFRVSTSAVFRFSYLLLLLLCIYSYARAVFAWWAAEQLSKLQVVLSRIDSTGCCLFRSSIPRLILDKIKRGLNTIWHFIQDAVFFLQTAGPNNHWIWVYLIIYCPWLIINHA